MPFVPQIPETEELIDAVPQRRSSSSSFCFAVTGEAVYLATRRKGLVLGEPFETTRFPLSSIQGVSLNPARADTKEIVRYSVVVFFGVVASIADYERGGELSLVFLCYSAVNAYCLACAALEHRGRYRIRADIRAWPFGFDPQLELSTLNRAKAESLEAQVRFLDACRRVGLLVIDFRDSPSSNPLPAA